MTILETLLEILKYTIPAIIVYLLIRQFIKMQAYQEELKRKSSIRNDTLSLRLQAYERLMLFCERIRISSLVMRLRDSNMQANDLKNALLIAVQKEFEHNLTQQLYVSAQLWEMVELLKDETIAAITASFIQSEKASLGAFESDLYARNGSVEQQFGSRVKAAIRKEVQLYFQ